MAERLIPGKRYTPDGTPYTYVRGAQNWPGDRRFGKGDEQISALWREGKVTPVLQAGGRPFDLTRLPSLGRTESEVWAEERRVRMRERDLADYRARRGY